MTFSNWLRSLRPQSRRAKAQKLRQRKLFMEPLEERRVLSTFQVTNTHDSGAGSLRQAIIDANTLPGADTIKFKHSGEGTITLSSQLDITSDLTINGPGANKSTVSGGGTTRVFHIAGGATVKIEELTVANGFVQDDAGGGILNDGTLTLEDSVVTGNKAVGINFPSFISGHGGGIYNNGTLTAKDCKITGNTAQTGAGLYAGYYGSATLDSVTLSNNTSQRDGAAIANSGTLTITDSTIKGNTGLYYGSDVWAFGGKVTITNTTIRDNKAASAGLYFGLFAEALISHCTITHNQSIDSNGEGLTFFSGVGGVWSDSMLGVRIEDTTISNNIGSWAGGVGSRGGSGPEIVRSTISGNTANLVDGWSYPLGGAGHGAAGGIFGPTAKIENSTISGNTVEGGSADYVSGGVLTWTSSYGSPSIDHSTIAFNKVTSASSGGHASGGVLGANTGYGDSNIAVRNTIIAKNEAVGGDPDVQGAFASLGHNLIGVLNANATGFVASDLSGTAATPLDPLLLPLRHNGGPTRTHALAKHSPAINAGDNTDAPATDQRGKPRIVGGTIDIGSYERRAKVGNNDDDDDFWKSWQGDDPVDDDVVHILASCRPSEEHGHGNGHGREFFFRRRH